MSKYTIPGSNRAIAAVAVLGLIWMGAPGRAWAVGKAHGILMQRGLQLQGMVTKDDVFHLGDYQNANYTAIHWLWESNPSLHGSAPGFPWARWAQDETKMPNAAEQPYLSQLVALQLGDEWHLNGSATRDRAVNWFNAIRSQWPNTILYMNNWGGQVNDAALGDFINRAQPDMLAFDTYPWRSAWAGPGQAGAPLDGPPTSWYGELRRYRVYALNYGLPLAIYRQTFHAIQDYDQTVYRDPSPSEMNLNTFGALAFGTTTIIDFTYNTGASNVRPNGNEGPGYDAITDINHRARNLGKSLVHLRGMNSQPNGGVPTTDIMFLRGRTGPNATDVTALPIGFTADPEAPNVNSWWEFSVNDPWLTGWARDNIGTVNSDRVGDVIISWFKPLDPARDDPNDVDDQIYMMVVNGLTSPTGTAADARQKVTLDFLKTVAGENFPGIVQLNPVSGVVETLPLVSVSNKWRIELTLDGGEGRLLKFNTGHAFLGMSSGLSGDFNNDGVVNMADYVFWRNGGPTFTASYYNVWRSNFGKTLGGSGSEVLAAVPEPSAWLLFASAMLFYLMALRNSPV